MTTRQTQRVEIAALTLAVGVLAACRGSVTDVQVKGDDGRSLDAAVGQQVVITLQTIGPGSYASPPAISSGAVQFVDVRQSSTPVPAGPTQEFRFLAVAKGTAVVRFTHTEMGRPVADTIRVH